MPNSQRNIHATCIVIGAKGVLLLGKSGAGKSDVALRLIDDGAQLVADDRTILFRHRGAVHAKASASIAGLLEIRGLGIIKLAARKHVKLALVVTLDGEVARLPKPQFYSALDCNVPQIALDGRFASTPAKIRAALAAFSAGGFRDTFNLK